MSCFHSSHFSSLAAKLILVAILLSNAAIQADCLNFNYTIFSKEDRNSFIFTDHSDIIYDALQVTSDVIGKPISNLFGRVVYQSPLKVWSRKKNITASFNSTFVINITNQTYPGGEGLAFIIAKDSSPPNNSQGQWLGIVNQTTDGTALTQIVAVEFDTRKSFTQDLDDNHVGVDVNSIYSINQVSLNDSGIHLADGVDVTVTIQYDGVLEKLNVSVFWTNETGDQNKRDPIISMNLRLSEFLPEDVYVGFSASTGDPGTQLNCVKAWYFNSSDLHEKEANLLWLWILISVTGTILLGPFFAYCIFQKTGSKKVMEQEEEDKYPGIEHEIQISATAPHKYQLKELRNATDNFHPKNQLGEGGFGKVYKGILDNKEVAVKRISKESRQGKQEFLAEVKTISGLHHKNLVKLVGWCYESNELLLIYEFMPNGSLDKLIFGDKKSCREISALGWETRHNIICGVGEALDYLHHGCEKRVLHRDIKASNIMLDLEFKPRLGDFGLARTIQLSERTHHSTKEIAGTPGYIAPEFFHTGRASTETDVYAFGILLLEVSTGRKPGTQSEESKYINGIVEWVWELYRKERITDAMDVRLNGDYQQEQAACVLLMGLACCHPNPYKRPSMRTVLQVLIGEADPPDISTEKPVFMWPAAPPSFALDLEISLTGGQITPFSGLSGR